MDKLSALRLAYKIITDKRNSSRYCSTSIISKITGEKLADYDDACAVVAATTREEFYRRKNVEELPERDDSHGNV